MFLTPQIDKAIQRATVLHHGQERKGTGAPYIVHPYAVAFLLAHYTDDEDVIIAGLLHDVLEDVPHYTPEDLRKEFGERVLSIVLEVTEDFTEAEREDHSLRKDSWRARKEKYLLNLSDDSQEALMVAAADKIHNLRSLLEGFQASGGVMSPRFNAGKNDLLWFYGEATRIISERLNHPLSEELESVFKEAEKTFLV
ncbi:MAG: HD domain-containing protein [Patescibacteria group bacterium]|mgnify:CR=1 FL=1